MYCSMASGESVVKREYDATGRRQRAAATRLRVLDVAQERFLRDGYAATTIASIAADAQVSAETIYKTFRGKAGLVRALYDKGLAGQGEIPAPERSDAVSARDLDAPALLREWTNFSIEVAPRVAPVMLLVHTAAAADAEAAALAAQMNAQRLDRMEVNAQRLLGRAGLRRRLTARHVADVLFTYTSPELYELLILQRQWPLDAYADFLYRGMAGQLLNSLEPKTRVAVGG